MSAEPAITVTNVSKTYRIYGNPYGRIKEMLPWNEQRHHQEVRAVQDLSFEVLPGQCVGLVGGNGAGKSTLLKILTGTTFPDTGSYRINGKVASLLELGAGFTMDFTGRENIYMNGAIMGIGRHEMKRRFDEILAFSELEKFIDAPLRTYSSGMICRLGFSVAVATEPDVLIIDEILSVGDMHFQRKCVERIYDYKQRGKTLLFCSHSLYDVRQICDYAIWLDQGEMRMAGDAVAVTNEYATFQSQLAVTRDPNERSGTLDVVPTDYDEDLPHLFAAELFDPTTGEPRSEFATGQSVGVRIGVRNGSNPEEITIGFAVSTKDRSILFSASTEMDRVPVRIDTEGYVTLILPDLRLLAGEYVLMCGVMDRFGFHRYHQLPTSRDLKVSNATTRDLGLFRHTHEWHIEQFESAADRAGPSAESERTV